MQVGGDEWFELAGNSGGGAAGAAVGASQEQAGEAGTVEGAVEEHQRKVGEDFVAVIVGRRSAEPGTQPGCEGVEGDGERIGFAAPDIDEVPQERVGGPA